MNAKYWSIAAAASLFAAQALAADVGVSISIGQPGFYGQIDIGNYPRPEVVYAQPVVVAPVIGVARPPIYLYVPPGHAKHWAQHCHEYRACGERVYFVNENWYNNTYVPAYRERQGGGRFERAERGGGPSEGRGDGDGDRGRGHGRGKHKD